jgi:hypothetical protein
MIVERTDLKNIVEKEAWDLLQELTTGSKCMHTKDLFDITVKRLAAFGLRASMDSKVMNECNNVHLSILNKNSRIR